MKSKPGSRRNSLIDAYTRITFSDSVSFPEACAISDSKLPLGNKLPLDYWILSEDSDEELILRSYILQEERSARRVAAIERRLGSPSLNIQGYRRGRKRNFGLTVVLPAVAPRHIVHSRLPVISLDQNAVAAGVNAIVPVADDGSTGAWSLYGFCCSASPLARSCALGSRF